MNVALLLPARNEEEGLSRVLPQCAAHIARDAILVVDDGSTDGTAAAAARCGVRVLSLSPGCGKGAALRAGFETLLAEGRDAVITLDADGQHDPAAIPRLVAAAESTGADLVVGARDGAVSPLRRLANRASAGFLSLALGQRVADAQSGYRLYRANLLREAPLSGEGFAFETEILAHAAAAGRGLAFVPVPLIAARRPSHIHPIRDVASIVIRHLTAMAIARRARRARRSGTRLPA
jgi:glycosyltransferase involved in cell wall biosynthesis